MQYDASDSGPAARPGRLIYLMGPSGSGKDSLIVAARAALEARGIEITRRVITRSAEAVGEDAHGVSTQQFDALQAQGAFALHWRANGLAYGIPVQIDQWLAHGRCVLVNGSRAYLEQAQTRYPGLVPILLTVDLPVLRERLLARGRECGEEIEQRLARNQRVAQVSGADIHLLDNSTTLEDAVQRLLALLEQVGVVEG
ncbi:phosphonate metabolism protein/1,5-bisphosphokinase (PRPP-forming) PhnN [Pseudomonas sp. SDI]|uniref:phosphonate metabolism protein/1,5-bisphosphokinase (PRPP-forming) PhnN n=1 Tax=Pseudomonas sp. SDI TaxID=2170734 RepID=UPI000DE5CBDD|nr:phosphonate metabolism protein/1,5-bisphosphokinase (PRPP-forming) PhnN [Pseudomonas sp. SDI]PWB33601.1 phosphonate metabolism protein/1,5-bisphosphokinase (PRPP-forming) PhnN [Pseudomonas sp. SDI]